MSEFELFNEIFLKDGVISNQDLFKKMCSGYVSYFKGGNPVAYPYKKTIIMTHPMNEIQYTQYKSMIIKEVSSAKKTLDKTIENKISKFNNLLHESYVVIKNLHSDDALLINLFI